MRSSFDSTKDTYYSYVRSDGRLTTCSHDLLLARKARYRQRHRAELMEKARRRMAKLRRKA